MREPVRILPLDGTQLKKPESSWHSVLTARKRSANRGRGAVIGRHAMNPPVGSNNMRWRPWSRSSRATLRHAPAMTGRDGAIDFAAKVETSSTDRVMLEMPPGELKSIDAWIKTQPAPRPSRPEAIRRLVEQALAGAQRPQKRSKETASKAREMAGQEVDRLGDASLSADERKRLTKGPVSFVICAATSPSRRADDSCSAPVAPS